MIYDIEGSVDYSQVQIYNNELINYIIINRSLKRLYDNDVAITDHFSGDIQDLDDTIETHLIAFDGLVDQVATNTDDIADISGANYDVSYISGVVDKNVDFIENTNIFFEYDAVTTDADPGTGKFRFNNASIALATFVYINSDDVNNKSTYPHIHSLVNGSIINLFESETGVNTYSVRVTGTVIASAGYSKIPIEYIGSGTGGSLSINDKFAFDMIPGKTTSVELGMAVSDETTDITLGTSKLTFRMPYQMTVTEVRANVNTAPVGSTIIVDINETGSGSILSTKLSIDAGEKTSTTAAVPAVISDASLADDSEITIDIDQIGSGTAGKGLKIWLIGRIFS